MTYKLATHVEKAFAKMEVTVDTYASLKSTILRSQKSGYVYSYNVPVLITVANQKEYGNNVADCAVVIENRMIEASDRNLGSCWVNLFNSRMKILKFCDISGKWDWMKMNGYMAQ